MQGKKERGKVYIEGKKNKNTDKSQKVIFPILKLNNLKIHTVLCYFVYINLIFFEIFY